MYGINKTPEQRALDFKFFLEKKGVEDVRISNVSRDVVEYKINNVVYSAFFYGYDDCMQLEKMLLGDDFTREELMEICQGKNMNEEFATYHVVGDSIVISMLICCPPQFLFEQAYKWMPYFVKVVEKNIG